jgi:hypothetical protein
LNGWTFKQIWLYLPSVYFLRATQKRNALYQDKPSRFV